MYMYMYMYIHVYMYVYIYIYICMYVCMYNGNTCLCSGLNQSVSQLYLFACVKDLKLHLAVMSFIHANLIAQGGVG